MADIICRWRNGFVSNVVELANALPHETMTKEQFRQKMSLVWDDFFKTPYQLACQLGLYCESEDGYYYPRFDHEISDDEAQKYLEAWILRYYIPNPYTAEGSFNKISCPTFVIRTLYEFVSEKGPSKLDEACRLCFKEESLGNLDIVKNYINSYSKILLVDKSGIINVVGSLPDSNATVLDGMDKKSFFDVFSCGKNMNKIDEYNSADNEKRKEMFYSYLVGLGKQISSCRQYAYTHPQNAVVLSAVAEVSHKSSLFEVVRITDIPSIYKRVNSDPVNKIQHNALSATISNYKKFLDYLETGILDKDGKKWILPANNSKFRIVDFFEKNDLIDWKQSCNFSVGDVAYFYCSEKLQRVLFKARVVEVDVSGDDYINDKDYWVNSKDYDDHVNDSNKKYVRFELLSKLNADDDRLSLSVLKRLGLNNTIQGPMTVPNQQIQEKLDEVFDGKVSKQADIKQEPFQISSVVSAIRSTGLIYDDLLVKRFAYSLLTKPFVILSGLAGSGKTQLALAFAKALIAEKSQMCVVSVGSDWTNREPLLGYPNALKDGEYVHPESGVLDLLIEANKQENKGKPYFLILDEMNLSYVERYFADFLSAMESHESIRLWDCESDKTPKSVDLPRNLFIIGTINVDETTYMFSPKVLDRANVIEFKVSESEMDFFLDQSPIVDLNKIDNIVEQSADFVRIASQNSAKVSKDANDVLKKFFKPLKNVNAEFGYRTATEIGRFISLAETLSSNERVDSAIVQKLLPKLHGSRKKIVPVLKALWEICGNKIDLEIAKTEDANGAEYPLSSDKILRMYQSAIDNGFTSFAEA